METRSDFADELINKKSKDYKKEEEKLKDVKITTIDILKENNTFNKEKGKYISLDFDDLTDNQKRINICDAMVYSLKKIYKIKKDDKVLIVGLGNQKILADSLGPMVADKIVVTNHLFRLFPNDVDKDLKRVCVFTPKVMGQTGLESADLIECVVNLFKPQIIIVVDALASSSIKRINKVIQISDTGISPGSGIGNNRKEISEKTLKTKIIAIGVATVVEASKIIKEINELIKIPKDDNYNLVLTPKEIDEDIDHLSTIIATSINKYIHKNFTSM